MTYICSFGCGEEYEVSILDSRKECDQDQFKVRFLGCHKDYDRWVSSSQIVYEGTMGTMVKYYETKKLPLLSLPSVVTSNIFKIMETNSVLNLSLASKKTYKSIQSANLKLPSIYIHAKKEPFMQNIRTLAGEVVWNMSIFQEKRFRTVQEWLTHIVQLYYEPKVKLKFYQESREIYEYRQVARHLERICFANNISLRRCEKVLEVFPSVRKIKLRWKVFVDEGTSTYIVGNSDNIAIDWRFHLFPPNDERGNFFATISRCIKIDLVENPPLNEFLKSWIVGRKFRNLRSIEITNQDGDEFEQQTVLQDIKHEELQEDEAKKFETVNGWATVRGGVKIVANNGSIATIKFEKSNNVTTTVVFGFYIW